MEIKADVVFVTELEVSGFMNGVINLAFSTAQFVPVDVVDDEASIDNPRTKTIVAHEPVITANLRMDLRLAQILRARLDELIEDQIKPAPKATN